MPEPASPLPPSAILHQLLWGKTITACLSALAKLAVADHMENDPVSVESLAQKTSAHAPSLYRIMRMLASLGVFHELPGRLYSLTPIGRCLRSDAPDSLRALAIMRGDEWQMRAYEQILHSLRTGQDGITAAYGKNVFEVFQDLPEQAENFNRCMTHFSAMETAALDSVIDFSAFTRIADIGGGHGMLLGHILRKHPHLQGVLFDLPSVINGAASAAHLKDCSVRVSLESGSMFERVPAGCDAYIMKHIVHDWSDEHNQKIFQLIREQLTRYAPESGRLFVFEMIVPDVREPGPAKMLDIDMLLYTVGGKERTVPEFSALFEASGLELVDVRTTDSPTAILEARVVRS